jgi:orotate phosphoribosyltransferase
MFLALRTMQQAKYTTTARKKNLEHNKKQMENKMKENKKVLVEED